METTLTTSEPKQNQAETSGVTRVIRAVCFATLAVVLFIALNDTIMPRWYGRWMSSANARIGLYELPENSVDAVALGPSACIMSFVPMELYKNYGISAWNLGTEQQPLFGSFALLQEFLKRQNPKVVFIEMISLHSGSIEAFYRKPMDNIKLTPDKVTLAADHSTMSSSDSFISYIVPWLKYHTNWKGINKTNFTLDIDDYPNWHQGYVFNGPSRKDDREGLTEFGTDVAAYNTEAAYYLAKIITLCKERDIKVVLYSDLGTASPARHNAITAFAKQHGVQYVDFNTQENIEKYGLYMGDSAGAHPFTYGAIGMTNALGQIATESIKFEDRRGNARFAYLDDWLTRYEREMELQHMMNEWEFSEYLLKLKAAYHAPDLVMLLSVKDEATGGMSAKLKQTLRELGFGTDFNEKYRRSFIGVWDGGNVTYEKIGGTRTEALSYGATAGGITFKIESAGMEAGNRSVIQIGTDTTNRSRNERGFNVVVFNKKTGGIVQSVSWDTCAEDGEMNAIR